MLLARILLWGSTPFFILPCTATLPGGEAPPVEAPCPARIDQAVRAGRENLLGRFEGILKRSHADYPMGRLALPLAALLQSGLSSRDPRVEAALRKLETLEPGKTYGVVCCLLALDAFCERRYEEAFTWKEGDRSPGWPPRLAEGELRARMEKLTRWLVSGQVRGHGSWTYSLPRRGSRHDFSNTQFAVLGVEIALKHGITVPGETLLDVARCFTRAQIREKKVVEVRLSRDLSLLERVRARRPQIETACRTMPGGWAYTDPTRSRGQTGEPYASMTAAGASSLAIALEELRVRNVRPPPGAEPALYAAYAWIAAHFDEFLEDGKNLPYTLYSLEKVGDVTGLKEFHGRDWYQEGARTLLEKQDTKGGWGSYVDSSLALLFLTRATRCAISAAPVVLTGGDTSGAQVRDLVYIDSLEGFLSAGGLLRHLGETRNPALVSLCREAVAGCPPDRAEELVPTLLLLWSGTDRVTAFAQSSLEDITGRRSRQREEYVGWLRELGRVRRLEAAAGTRAEEVAALLEDTTDLRLRGRIALQAARKGLRSLTGLLIREMDQPSVEYRRALHVALSLWVEPPETAPAEDDPREWERVAGAWRRWWSEEARGQPPQPPGER